MDFTSILLTKEIPIATIQLNRPHVLNVLNHELMMELTTSLEQLDSDEIRKLHYHYRE